jgi:hypothetical protein
MEAEIDDQPVGKSVCTKSISREALHWIVGIANMCVILALFILAVVKAPSSARLNNSRCLQQIANEEHVALEAFFQNPTEQDALAQAVAICAR